MILMAALLAGGCGSPARAIRPVIYGDYDEGANAMKTAPMIYVIRIAEMDLTGDVRDVAKPPETGGPNAPTIPLHLARIKADVLITVRGEARKNIKFYSWIWASGSHGGPRLFHAHPGNHSVVFLRDEGGYAHTVGDYPSYDLELYRSWLPTLVRDWNSEKMNGVDPLARLVALRLRVEFESMTIKRLREGFGEDGPKVNHHWAGDMYDLVRVAGPLFVANQIDDTCLHSSNPSARFAACYVTAVYFPGRCEAYRAARVEGVGETLLSKRFLSCRAGERELIDDVRSGRVQWWDYRGARLTEARRRETLRVFASAMDRNVHRAACEVAEGSIPECAGVK